MLQQGATPVLGLLSVVPQSGHHNSSTVANTHVIHRPIINQNVTQTRLFASQTQENKISSKLYLLLYSFIQFIHIDGII